MADNRDYVNHIGLHVQTVPNCPYTGKEITWRGRLGVPGLFDGTHHLKVEASDPAHTRFVQEEDFSGLLVPFAGLDPYRLGWEKMNRALKDRCEKVSSRMSPVR
jgi:hypothetical protein